MATTTSAYSNAPGHARGTTDDHDDHDDHALSLGSAVSWSAIFAGATAAAALSLILLMLGVGLGLSSVSPWANEGIGATAFGLSTILWLTLTQLLASGMGGYLAGRLRTRWPGTHIDEVYFRDTAHGLLAWAVATLATAALLTSVIGSILGSGVQAAASVSGGVASTAAASAVGAAASADQGQNLDGGPMDYFIDSLFRRDTTAPGATSSIADFHVRTPAQDAAEIGLIFMNAGRSETLPPEDMRHVGWLVARRTGLTQQEAERRVSETYARAQARLNETETAARDAADKARKASAKSTLWLFVSLLAGAFLASLAATFGGRRRDA